MQSQPMEKEDDEGPPPGWQPLPTPPPQLPPQLPPRLPPPPQPSRPSRSAQMICGSCRRLLSYRRGAKHVKCSCCQTVNVVLEADQFRQVQCEGCAVMLMYPYGASQVRCSSCQFVTDIGAHSKQPPWSVQQSKSATPKIGC